MIYLANPDCVFNIDETGISTEHQPPKIVCNKDAIPQDVTSPRSSLVTIIACRNTIGNSTPPNYIFARRRCNLELLRDTCVGSSRQMTKNGWSNTEIFQKHITKHFAWRSINRYTNSASL